MSLEKPYFGEVFEYGKGAGKIMYVAPAGNQWEHDWIGLTIQAAGTVLATVGEVAQRVPLREDRYSHWRSLDEPD